MANNNLEFETVSPSLVEEGQSIDQNTVLSQAVQVNKVIDCRLLSNPLPIIKLRCEINKMKIGQQVELLVTDLESKAYIPLWCKRTGNEFIETSGECGTIKFVIQRKN